ncbi:uncharacterized protein LOC110047864 isoform X2 [Orbicella faveolata]|uniref:uncharacterized protein LOC110047864 isoform X2 n=1 Tax=Orbicella faveolata TaxID=48498 RepID=UPI0009E38FD2|nr:uncharacterized protein LOC110047864 isoform X2 [Orbicella faveolata]
MAKAAKNTTGSNSNDGSDVPPELSFSLPSIKDIQAPIKDQNDLNLPVEILLVTVTNCEFIACYMQLEDPLQCYFHGIGYVYFGHEGTRQEKKVNIALIRCDKGSAGPGSSLITVKNAVTVLGPKGVISVGTCSGLNPEKTKLGDVVVSAKISTYASKVVTSEGEQSSGMRSYVSRHFLDLIKHADHGWKAPLKNPEAQQVKVHCGEVLSGPEQVSAGWRREELAKSHPMAIAIEMEGEGIFTAAFDLQIEWLVVKGIADYADDTESMSENWITFASVMAASVVANILNDPVVFQEWPHFKAASLGITVDCETVKAKRLERTSDSTNWAQCKEGAVGAVPIEEYTPTGSEMYLKFAWDLYKAAKPSTIKEFHDFFDYLVFVKRLVIEDVKSGSLLITVKCASLQVLEELWADYTCGHLNEVVQKCLVTKDILTELGLAELKLKTTIREDDYKECKQFFQELAEKQSSLRQPKIVVPSTSSQDPKCFKVEEKQSSSQQLMGAVLSTSSQDPKRFKVEGI